MDKMPKTSAITYAWTTHTNKSDCVVVASRKAEKSKRQHTKHPLIRNVPYRKVVASINFLDKRALRTVEVKAAAAAATTVATRARASSVAAEAHPLLKITFNMICHPWRECSKVSRTHKYECGAYGRKNVWKYKRNDVCSWCFG